MMNDKKVSFINNNLNEMDYKLAFGYWFSLVCVFFWFWFGFVCLKTFTEYFPLNSQLYCM